MTIFGSESESPSYVAVIADIEGSRDMPDRAAFQRQLQETLRYVNRELGQERIAAPFRITAGDEIQGLLVVPADLVDVWTQLAYELSPVRFVMGAGWGRLATDLGPDAAVLDGPCFHRARHGLDEARRQGRPVQVEGIGEVGDDVVSALLHLIGAIRSGWTEKQARYTRESRRLLQKDVAERYSVSPSVISESLKAARFDAVLHGEAAARGFLSGIGLRTESSPNSAPGPNDGDRPPARR